MHGLRFLPTSIHGAIDYLWGVALIALPYALGFANGGREHWVAVLFGAGAILYSLLTAYELGVLRIIPMEMHLLIDGIAGALLAVSSWLFGFADQVAVPFVAFGLFSIAASLVTHTQPANPIRATSRP